MRWRTALVETGVRVALIAACSVVVVGSARIPAPTVQTNPAAAIDGLVREGVAAGGRLVAGATITVGGTDNANLTIAKTTSDAQGTFHFQKLPVPCNCEIRVSKSGYFDAAYGEVSEVSVRKKLSLTNGERLSGITVGLVPHSSISGRVLDNTSRPMVNVPVRIIRRVSGATSVHLIAGTATLTNDLGDYRIGGLRAADYVVSLPTVQSTVPEDVVGNPEATWIQAGPGARLRVGPYPVRPPRVGVEARAFPPVYFPGTPRIAEAVPVSLKSGDARTGVDFTVAPVRVFRISGRLTGSADAVTGLTVRLLAVGTETLGNGIETATAMADRNGAFVLVNVPAGAYLIEVNRGVSQLEDLSAMMTTSVIPRPPGSERSSYGSTAARIGSVNARLSTWWSPGDRRYWGRQDVAVVDRDITGVTVPLTATAALQGRIVADDGRRLDAMGVGSVRLESASANASLGLPRATARNAAEGASFSIDGILPGEYILKIGEFSKIKSILVDGQEALNAKILIGNANVSNVLVTLSTKAAEINGRVAMRDGVGTDEVAVVVFPAEREQWSAFGWSSDRMRMAPVSPTGTYRVADIPAGTYFIAAVDAAQSAEWRDRAFLQRVSQSASRVTITWGETKSVGLQPAAKD